MKLYNDVIDLKLERCEIFSLFNSLLIREKSIFKTANERTVKLLNKLWIEVDDRNKSEALWNDGFRNLLDKWEVEYMEDLKRLEIPLILEDDM